MVVLHKVGGGPVVNLDLSVCVLCVVSLLCCSLVFVCVFYVPCVSRDLCSQSSKSTFCLCIIVSTFSSHRFYCFLINQQLIQINSP
jgi:hypothetical protein